MARRPAPDPEAREAALALAAQAAGETRTMAYHADQAAEAARRRARLWRRALDLGLSAREVAEPSGLNPTQVRKALDRLPATEDQ